MSKRIGQRQRHVLAAAQNRARERDVGSASTHADQRRACGPMSTIMHRRARYPANSVAALCKRGVGERGGADHARLGADSLQRIDDQLHAALRHRHRDDVGGVAARRRDHAVVDQVGQDLAEDLRLQFVAQHLLDLLRIGERQCDQPQRGRAAHGRRAHLRREMVLGDQRRRGTRRPLQLALAFDRHRAAASRYRPQSRAWRKPASSSATLTDHAPRSMPRILCAISRALQ